MAIRGLGSFDMMSNYNRIDFRERSITAANEANQEAVKPVEPVKEAPQEPAIKVNLNLDGMRRHSSFGADDISRDFSRRELFSVTSLDEQSMKNDMLKAVSEMEKDASLMQYQYFVGDSNIIVDDEDGIVIAK